MRPLQRRVHLLDYLLVDFMPSALHLMLWTLDGDGSLSCMSGFRQKYLQYAHVVFELL